MNKSLLGIPIGLLAGKVIKDGPPLHSLLGILVILVWIIYMYKTIKD